MYLGCRCFVITIYLLGITVFQAFMRYGYFLGNFFCFYCSDHGIDNAFDYIIVGGGSAGSIVANRLSHNKSVKVLVLEAGKDGIDLFNIPSLGLFLQKTVYDWEYETVPQKNACLALDKNVSHWPMGKILGGTSTFNNMIYNRGHEKDFEEWFRDKDDYNYQRDILTYFNKLEEYNYETSADNLYGSVYVSDLIFTSILPNFLLKSAKSLGYSIFESNMDCKLGFNLPKVNLHNSKRWTTALKLKLQKKSNLFLKTNRIVEKVLFKGNYEAYAVKYRYLGKIYIARAKKGVILSAGVIGTPKILMLSGIGKKEHLEKLDIDVKVDLPVGDNLQDHITTGFDLVQLNQTLDFSIEKMLSPLSIIKYFTKGSGPWTTNGCELLAYFNMENISKIHVDVKERPDLQFMVIPLAIKEDEGVYLRKLIGISDHFWTNHFALNKHPSVTILPVLLHPKSKGCVRLADSNPLSKPLIDPQYLTDSRDVDVLVKGIELVKTLVESEEMKKFGAKFNSNVFPGCKHLNFDSRGYWECYVRHLTVTAYHPIGTCKMGHVRDIDSVVDYNFQVMNTNKLFIADGSVLPTLTSGNVNGAILMMAEMASDVIKLTDYLITGKCKSIDMFVPKNVC